MEMVCPRCWGAKFLAAERLNGAGCYYCLATGVVSDKYLSPHFKLSELLYSQTAVRKAISNESTDLIVGRLATLCTDVLEPLRAAVGPLRVDSGFRCPELNRVLSGSSTTSVHTLGWAADLVPLQAGVPLKSIIDWVVKSKLPFDQVIYEGTWIHIGRYSPAGKVRKMALMAFPNQGRMQYSNYAPTDRRVV